MPFTLSRYDIGRMDSDYDPEREAAAAMKMAVTAVGPERQRWIGLAMAWQELARMRVGEVVGALREGARHDDRSFDPQ